MADLESRPSDIEQSRENRVECILSGRTLPLEAAEERYEAGEDQYQPSHIPRFSLTKSGMDAIGEKPHSGSSQSIANLPSQQSSSCSLSHHDLLEKEEEIVEPACCNQIIDEMTNSIRPNMRLIEAIISVIR